MSGDLGSLLTPSNISAGSPPALLNAIKSWVLNSKRMATRHLYGFWVFLLDRTDFQEWRFHLWGRNRRPKAGMPAPIHTHDKFVDSRVLIGELENLVYEATPTQGGGLPVYEARHIGDKYSPENKNLLIKTADRRIPRLAHCQTITQGQSYTVPAHAFHEAKVRDAAITCTIARMHSQVAGPVRILGVDGYPETIEFMRESAPAPDVIAAELAGG
jgi:hypothetical protein